MTASSTYADRRELVAFLRRVDPGLSGPVYILPSWAARGRINLEIGGAVAEGLTGLSFSGALRDRIIGLGDSWQGDGFAAVIASETLTIRDAAIAVVLHEFAHFVEDLHRSRHLIDVLGQAAFFRAVAPPPERTLTPVLSGDVYRDQHGPPFIRICLHLGYRAHRAGWRGKLTDVVVPALYGLPPIREFRRALGSEPRRLRELPMVEVAAMKPPEEYLAFSRIPSETTSRKE